MKKDDLRSKFRKYETLTKHRLRNEGQIIDALPTKLEVERVTPPRRENSPENGGLEIACPDYASALGLADQHRALVPLRLSLIEAERTPGHVTRSFIPSCRVPVRWYNDGEGTIREVYPVLFQISQSDDPLRPRVTLEWYAELRPELIVNVRAIIQNHPVAWHVSDGMPHRRTWTWRGAPQAPYQRVMVLREGAPPFVTLWWDDTLRFLPFARLGSGEEVAHVKA